MKPVKALTDKYWFKAVLRQSIDLFNSQENKDSLAEFRLAEMDDDCQINN